MQTDILIDLNEERKQREEIMLCAWIFMNEGGFKYGILDTMEMNDKEYLGKMQYTCHSNISTRGNGQLRT